MRTLRTCLVSVAAVAVVATAAGAARAGGYAVAEQSALAGGTAGAGTARSGDASAAWYNPAALVDDGGWRVGAGLVLAVSRLHAAGTGDDAWRADTDGGATPVPQLQASFARGDFVAGLAIGVPFGGDVAWPADWEGRHEIISTRLAVIRAAPFVGWRFGALSIAGGVHVDVADLRIRRSLDFVDTQGDVEIAQRGAAAGVDAAAFVRISDEISAGLSYRSRSRIAMTGEADFHAPDAFSLKTVDQTATTEVALPDRIALGGAWRRGALGVLGDLELMTWSINHQQVIDFAQPQTPDVVQVNDWHTTLGARAGVEWTQARWAARGGLAYDPSPAASDHLSPVSPDSDRLQVSVGGTWRPSSTLAIDAFYAYMHLLERDSQNVDSMMASYGGDAHLLGLGVRWTR